MEIGIPKEQSRPAGLPEHRVALTPAAVRELIEAGARVYVERGAGEKAGFPDEAYRQAGATVVYSPEEVYQRAELIVKIGAPQESEWEFLRPEGLLMGFLHLAAAPKALLRALEERRITAIGYEVIQRSDGSLPVLRTMSEIAGKLAPQIAGRLLEIPQGMGILLAGLPGIPPADVVILGAGTLGSHAARCFRGLGASVYVLDRDLDRLDSLESDLGGQIVTAVATRDNVEKFSSFAEVLIGAVYVPGERTPVLLTREMMRKMRDGTVFVDFSIDQGGCSETSRLTPREELVYVEEGVIHFCVPNVPALVARTASHALSNALLPYLRELITRGRGALQSVEPLRRGRYLDRGEIVHPGLASVRGEA